MAPIQSNMAKPENKHLQNLTHSGVVGGGVRALGPYCSKLALAWEPVKPLLTSVPNLLQSSGIGTLWTSNSSSCLRLSIRALSENMMNIWFFCEICTIIKSFNFTFFLFSEHHLEQIVLETQPTMSKWGTRGTSLGPSIVAKLSTLCSWLVELLSPALNTFENKMHKIVHEKFFTLVLIYHSKD